MSPHDNRFNSRRAFLGTSAAAVGGALSPPASPPLIASTERGDSSPLASLTLNPATRGFDFETDEIAGTIQPEGRYHGITRLVDKRTGRQVIDPRYSALNLFKLHSVNHFMGQPRDMARATVISPTAVEIKWQATAAYQGEITARYQAREPNIVDVHVTVRSRGTYPAHEILLPSYFDKVLRPHVYLQRRRPADEPQLVSPSVNDVFRELLLAFPRDAHAARNYLDGRWERNESQTPTVQNCPARHYAHCMAFLTDPENELAVVLMSHPRHAYGLSARYYADRDEDRQTTYSAVDFSLFGDDLLPGDERTVRARIAVTRLDKDFSQPLALYQAFLSDVKQ